MGHVPSPLTTQILTIDRGPCLVQECSGGGLAVSLNLSSAVLSSVMISAAIVPSEGVSHPDRELLWKGKATNVDI
jgi:hypothetical protein